jgi:diguanylate cyclase (GGDEF)-like protein/PAS domain S-box-containing protein
VSEFNFLHTSIANQEGLQMLLGVISNNLFRNDANSESKPSNFPVMLDSKLNVLANAIEQNSTSMMVTDENGIIQYINPYFNKETGYSIEDLQGKTPVVLTHTPDDIGCLKAIWDALQKGETWVGELACKRKSGESFWAEARFAPVRDIEGNIKHCVSTLIDISVRKLAQEQLSHMAHHDVLTDLPNRLSFFKQFTQNLSLAKRQKSSLGIMFVDLDDFKRINDNYGHAHGDAVLQETAKRMSACIRESDVIGRIGGDEFLILLADIDSEEGAIIAAKKIQKCLELPFSIENKSEQLSCSIGIAIFPHHGTSEAEIAKNADTAMYEIKSKGKNGVAVFKGSVIFEHR